MEDQTPEMDLLYGLITNNDEKIGEFTLHLEVTRVELSGVATEGSSSNI
jgi:hypothetical protein